MAQTNEQAPTTPPKIPNKPQTSESTNNDENTGESTVQEGQDVVNTQEQERIVNEGTEPEEFVDNVNVETKEASAYIQNKFCYNADDDDEDDDDDDEDDDDGDPLEIGDDPSETKKKIPVM